MFLGLSHQICCTFSWKRRRSVRVCVGVYMWVYVYVWECMCVSIYVCVHVCVGFGLRLIWKHLSFWCARCSEANSLASSQKGEGGSKEGEGRGEESAAWRWLVAVLLAAGKHTQRENTCTPSLLLFPLFAHAKSVNVPHVMGTFRRATLRCTAKRADSLLCSALLRAELSCS